MHPALRFVETAYVEAQNLLPVLGDYNNPRDFLSRLVKRGELIRLKNGFFVIPEKIEKAPVPYEQIANILYGPSYISCEWALSYYGAIPEGVYVVTSVTEAKSKSYKTPLGTFDYIHLSHSRYAVGIDQQENSGGNFLIATPEKALIDLIHVKAKKMGAKELLVDLIEGRRIEESFLKKLDKKLLQDIIERYHSQAVNKLMEVVGLL